MADSHATADPQAGKYHFLLRRLHSLSGLVPLGVFICVHLGTNASVLISSDSFQEAVERIHSLGALLIPVEIVGIFLPLLFHIVLGFQIMLTSQSNAQHYRYGGNIRYTLQRATAIIAFVFVIYHIYQMHWLGAPIGGGAFELHQDGQATGAMTTAQALRSAGWIKYAYAIGVIATVFHMANGIWTSLITWGITIRPKTQKLAGYVCAVIGVAVAIAGLGSLRGFMTLPIEQEHSTAAPAVSVEHPH